MPASEKGPSIFELTRGMMVSQALFAIVRHGIPDALNDGPRSADDLGTELGLEPEMVRRTLRYLACFDLFATEPDGRFRLTDGSQLVEGHPSQMRNLVITGNGPMARDSWAKFPEVLETGETGLELAFGMGLFDYLGEHEWENQAYNGTMEAFAPTFVAGVVQAWDFSQYGKIMDVGGGHGHLIAAIVEANPELHGTIFEIEQVVDVSRSSLKARGLTDRVDVVTGDFFKEVPGGFDAYLLAHILHDWNDDRAIEILRNCRAATRDDARLLIAEGVLPEGDGFHPSKLLDVVMMVNTGGKERTLDEWKALTSAADFELAGVHSAGQDCLIECVPA